MHLIPLRCTQTSRRQDKFAKFAEFLTTIAILCNGLQVQGEVSSLHFRRFWSLPQGIKFECNPHRLVSIMSIIGSTDWSTHIKFHYVHNSWISLHMLVALQWRSTHLEGKTWPCCFSKYDCVIEVPSYSSNFLPQIICFAMCMYKLCKRYSLMHFEFRTSILSTFA